jgi:ribosome-binding protein aMBF1 (putative translation factor)
MSGHITRGRRLTPEEVAKYREMREQVEREKDDIARRLKNEAPGPGTWADLHELRSLVQSLRAERERRGLSREEVGSRSGIELRLIEELEEHRELNPQISTLTRFAAAVGRHLMMGLAAGEPIRVDPPIVPLPTSTTMPEASQP